MTQKPARAELRQLVDEYVDGYSQFMGLVREYRDAARCCRNAARA